MESVIKRIVIVESDDVAKTIGADGVITKRLGDVAVTRMSAQRSDLLLQRLAGTAAPEEIDVPDGLRDWWEAQTADLRAASGTVLVVSLRTDLVGPHPLRHSASGYLVDSPNDAEHHAQLIASGFEPAPTLSVAETVENFEAIADLLDAADATLVIFGVSTYDPDDTTHDYADVGETFAVAANRMLMGIENLTTPRRIAFVNVDRSLAELGAKDHVSKPASFSQHAAEYITDDAFETMADTGILDSLLVKPVMDFSVPVIDPRTKFGEIVEWHAAQGDHVAAGEPIARLKFKITPHNDGWMREDMGRIERWRRRRRNEKLETNQSITVDVITATDVYLASILEPAGANIVVDQLLGIVTTTPAETGSTDRAEGTLRTRVTVKEQGR